MTRTELLALERAQINPLNRWLWDKVVAAEAASGSQAADRKVEIDARIAAEKLLTDQVAETTRVYQEGAEQFDTLRQSLLLAGDAAGLLAATTERAFANPNGQYTAGGQQYGLPQWTEGTTAAQFNYAYGEMQARLRRDLSDDLSANALRVQNVGPALQSLSVNNVLGASNSVTGPVYLGIRDAIVQAAGDASFAVRDAVDGAALVAAQAQVRGSFGASGPGLASVYSAMAQPQVIMDSARAYSDAVGKLNGAMRSGAISTEQFGKAMEALQQVIPNPGSDADIAAAVQGAQYAIGRAGFDSIKFYFGQLGSMVEELAAAAAEAAEPIAQASAAIGRFNSASTAFGVSARAAMSLPSASIAGSGLSLEYAADTISKSALIAEAAAIASGLVTTADAAKVQEQTGLSRDAALLIDGVRAYDAASLEKAFLRVSDALVKGVITESEYAKLFNTSLDIFQDVEARSAELASTFDALREAAKSLADELLLDKTLSTLSGPQQLEEAQRQYRETLAAAFEGDAQAAQSLGGVAKTMLGIAQATAVSSTDYARIFGSTIADTRNLESIRTPDLPVYQASQGETVRELRALRAEVAALRSDQREGLAQVASGTNTTARRLTEWTANGLPATETV